MAMSGTHEPQFETPYMKTDGLAALMLQENFTNVQDQPYLYASPNSRPLAART